MIRLCPICNNRADLEKNEDFPFCSERCKMIDLGNWSSERYRISEPVIDESVPDAQHPPAEQDAGRKHK